MLSILLNSPVISELLHCFLSYSLLVCLCPWNPTSLCSMLELFGCLDRCCACDKKHWSSRWIIFSNCVMLSCQTHCWVLQIYLYLLELSALHDVQWNEVPLTCIIENQPNTYTADIAKARQFTANQSRQPKSTMGKRRKMHFWFW